MLEFSGRGMETDVLGAFSDAVRGGVVEGLAGSGIKVMTRENMMVLLRSMGRSDCAEGDCEIETARNIGADFVISGSVVHIEDSYVVTLKLHESREGSLLGTDRVTAKTQLDALDQLHAHGQDLVARKIVSPSHAAVSPMVPAPEAPPPVAPVQPSEPSLKPSAHDAEKTAAADVGGDLRHGTMVVLHVGASKWVDANTGISAGGIFGGHVSPRTSLNGEVVVHRFTYSEASTTIFAGSFSPLFDLGADRLELLVGPKLGAFADYFSAASNSYSYSALEHGLLYGLNAAALFQVTPDVGMGLLASFTGYHQTSVDGGNDAKLISIAGALRW